MNVRAKAHGLGNDFVLVDAGFAPAQPQPWARRLCDRHVGIGGDGLLLGESRGADRTGMRLFNADGSEAEVSGNGVRCVAAWGVHRGVVGARSSRSLGIAGPRRRRWVSARAGRPHAGAQTLSRARDAACPRRRSYVTMPATP